MRDGRENLAESCHILFEFGDFFVFKLSYHRICHILIFISLKSVTFK